MFERIYVTDEGALAVTLESDPVVQSRVQLQGVEKAERIGSAGLTLAGGLPIGVARAQTTTEEAQTTPDGWIKWRDGDYESWWDSHGSQVQTYKASITQLAFSYRGTTEQYEEDPESVNFNPTGMFWDGRRQSLEKTNTWNADLQTGWYRIGAEPIPRGDSHQLGWEFVDIKLERPDTETAASTDEQSTAATTNGSVRATATDASADLDDDERDAQLRVVKAWKISPSL